MNNNYLVVSDLYKADFLSNDTALRNKQGLASQQSAALSCTTARQGVNTCYQYPITLSTVNYGPGSISDNCPCTRFVQPQ